MSKVARYNVGDLVRSEPSPAADYEDEVGFGANGILIADEQPAKVCNATVRQARPFDRKEVVECILKPTLATS